jgi:SAM-dependent methyltransferase
MDVPSSVEEQYLQYSYPEPGDDIPQWLKTWSYAPYDPSLYEAQFWPEGRPRADLNILVAGCGTMQGAVLAFRNPGCNITAIDFSQTSLSHEQRLREKHNLNNLILHKMDLRDVSKLDQSFDLIVSSGVLHHLPDPDEGLRALASVLEPRHGAMLLMLYGRFARIGVYALQDVFRRLRIPQTADGVKFVRATIQRLPPRHPARWYFDTSAEMSSDAAIVDTFLHKQDTAYSVEDVLAFAEKNGVRFKGWLDSALYSQEWDGIDPNLPDRDRWSAAENISGRIAQHRFMVSLPERDSQSQITFEDSRWLNYFPQCHPELRPSDFDSNKAVRGNYEVSVSPFEAILLTESKGSKPIGQIMKHKGLAGIEPGKRNALTKNFYTLMFQLGHVFLSVVPICD